MAKSLCAGNVPKSLYEKKKHVDMVMNTIQNKARIKYSNKVF